MSTQHVSKDLIRIPLTISFIANANPRVQSKTLSKRFALLLALATPYFVGATDFNVAPFDVEGLIGAINQANDEGLHPGPDTINLGAGVYTLTRPDMTANVNNTNGVIGLPSITSVITIKGLDVDLNVIERSAAATADFRIFHVTAGGVLELDSLTITGGRASPLESVPLSGDGGGILNGGTLSVINSLIFDNRATSGGGILNFGSVTITGSTIVDNEVSTFGGGINSFGNDRDSFGPLSRVRIIDSTVRQNRAALDGGGVEIGGGDARIIGSTISDNFANRFGGGITNSGATLLLVNSTVSRNSAFSTEGTASGGGIGACPKFCVRGIS
jgi:hypothetical protein